jgi:hypothetical protein
MSRAAFEPGFYKEAVLNFKAANLLNHGEEKLSKQTKIMNF